ncbi:hypothetical protein C1646_746219 [Rhizophagus diaphanus]|nr:hypothetical protein C1646_746219 [Rhizophagus diaphanus] [Rhizophagus sp. MUCL 43196]
MYSAYPSFTAALLKWQKKEVKLLANSSDSKVLESNKSKNSSKKSKNSKKKLKKKYQPAFSKDSDGSIQIENLTQKSDDEKMFDDNDREITIDRLIEKASGSQLIVDQSLLNVSQSDQHVLLILDITPQPRSDDQLKKKVEDLTKVSNKKKKSNKVQIQNVITELSTFHLAQFEVNEDPIWTTDLGIPVRWFPARWTLKERKQREKFQATIHKIPDSMTLATLWKDNHPHSFLSAVKGLKSFKIVQTVKGERKLIGYFEKWIDMHTALDNQCVWEQVNLSWSRYEPPTQSTKSKGDNTNKKLQEVKRLLKSNRILRIQKRNQMRRRPTSIRSRKRISPVINHDQRS